MMWGAPFRYASVEETGMEGLQARSIQKVGDEIIINEKMVFPVSGGGIVCYEYAV